MEDSYAPFESLPQPQQQQQAAPRQRQAAPQPQYIPAQQQQQQHAYAPHPVQHSLLDRMLGKKKDLMKLVVLSLAVLLAILLYHLIVKYLKHTALAKGWSDEQEMGMLLLATIATLLLMWVIKTNNSEDRPA